MCLMRALWGDESGLILSAEMVTIGTVGVLGAIVGLNAVGSAVTGEMKDMAFAIRSLDQSYGYVGHSSRGAWTAGSYYRQPDVQQSLAELSADGDINAIQQRIDADRKVRANQAAQPTQPTPIVEPTPTPLPNQIPSTNKTDGPKEREAEVVPPKADNPKSD